MKYDNCSCEHCRHKICTRKVPIFTGLNTDEAGRIVDLIVRRQYAKGELIVLEGTNLQSLIIINHGRVKAYRSTQDGKEQILYIFADGDFFGEKNLLRNQPATYSVEALEDSGICMIQKDGFQKLLHEHPGIGIKVMEELCRRLEKLEHMIESMGAKNVETRISSVLLEFAEDYGKAHPEGILVELPLSREGIANYIGLTRETVSRKMNLLQDEGTIRMIGNKKVLIKDKSALEESLEQLTK